MKKAKLTKFICGGILTTFLFSMSGAPAFAASSDDIDIDAQIASAQRMLQQLNDKKNAKQTQDMQEQMESLQKQLRDLKNKPSYDAKGAIDSIAAQIIDLQKQLDEQEKTQARIASILDRLDKKVEEEKKTTIAELDGMSGTAKTVSSGPSTKYLINPGPEGKVSYTQDAINSQGNSTMMFVYAPNQLYKIYCRKGYLTDLSFHPGEKINFVGGGDTSGWMVSNTDVDGVPHLYIKPVVDTSTTNLIVTTDKHSYQIILNTSDWYNPMVTWTYDNEARDANLIKQQKDERITTGKISATSVDDLDFNYTVDGNGDYKPVMVFSDGEQTYLKFKKEVKQKLPLFVRERGMKSMNLVNYRIKDNYIIVEKVFDVAQIKVSNDDTITIKHKN